MGLEGCGVEADEVIARADINGAIAKSPGIGVGSCCEGIDDNRVVARASVNGGVVIDANGIGIATAVPPPPAAIAVGIGVDVDGVITGAGIEVGVIEPFGVSGTTTPPPTAAIGARVGVDRDGIVTGTGIDIGVFNCSGLRVAATAGCIDRKTVMARAEVNVGVG